MNDVNEYPVYCKKYEVAGKVVNYAGLVIKLLFSYRQREFEIGLETSFFIDDNYESKASGIMESCIENMNILANEQKLKMYYWYIDSGYLDDTKFCHLHGNVSGHPSIMDSVFTHTSYIKEKYVDWKNEEFVVRTRNNTYFCPLEYCNFYRQDNEPEMVPEYEIIKERYEGKLKKPEIEAGKVLMVISNFDDYYFHSLCYIPDGDNEVASYTAKPHIGSFQDSFLIGTKDNSVELRYFPHYQNIEFYCEHTNGLPWYIENVGDISLYCVTSKGVIKVNPGERKEVCKENAEVDVPVLGKGDLYPAGIWF